MSREEAESRAEQVGEAMETMKSATEAMERLQTMLMDLSAPRPVLSKCLDIGVSFIPILVWFSEEVRRLDEELHEGKERSAKDKAAAAFAEALLELILEESGRKGE